MLKALRKHWLIPTVWALRLLVGGVFVMSGFVKMVDPWGFIFKLEEYLGLWGMSVPRTIVLIGAMAVSGFEFVVGALLAMGCYKRVAPWLLLLMMGVMLPLTAYIWLENPVSDCGCFGDFWKISNRATFLKNLLITAALVALAVWNRRVKRGLFSPAIQWVVGGLITLYIILIGLYGYSVAPVLDFRSYPEGVSLAETEGAEEPDYAFIYRKGAEEREFSIDNLPDSTWEFVDRRELPSQHSAQGSTPVPANPLVIFSGDEDVTSQVIAPEGNQLVVVIPEPRRADISYTFTVNEMYEYADSCGIPLVALLGGGEEAVRQWEDIAMAEYPCYSADDTQLKELSRGALSVVSLYNGRVTGKATVSSMNGAVIESPRSETEFLAEVKGRPRPQKVFLTLNVAFGVVLLLLYLCQGVILAVRFKIRQNARKAPSAKEEPADVG